MGDLGVDNSSGTVRARAEEHAGKWARTVHKHGPEAARTAIATYKEGKTFYGKADAFIDGMGSKVGIGYVTPEKPKILSNLAQAAFYTTAAGLNCVPIFNYFIGPTIAGATVLVGGAVAKAKSDNPDVVNDANLALQTTAAAVALSPVSYLSAGLVPAPALPYGRAALKKLVEAGSGIKAKFFG